MNSLVIVAFACLAAFANADIFAGARFLPTGPTTLVGASGVVGPNGAVGPSGTVTGNGAIGPNGLASAYYAPTVAAAPALGFGLARAGWVGAYDDGQYHGEGLWESLDHAGSYYGLGYRAW